MKRLNLIARLTSLVLLVSVVLCLSFVPVSAAATGSVTVNFPVEDAEFHIYRVGSFQNGKIVFDSAFKGVDTSDMVAAAAAMADIVRFNTSLRPLVTDQVKGGKVTFRELPMAAYLIEGEKCEMDGKKYYPVPCLLSMPQEDEAGEYVWDVTVSGKMEVSMDISVVKKWVGDSILSRPASITVHLMRDGKEYGDPVKLNYANKWSYMWEDLEPAEWYVKEDASPRYTCTVTRNGNTFVITNTWKKIPQTGQLWWPVTALTVGGIAFICLGLLRRRKRDEDA